MIVSGPCGLTIWRPVWLVEVIFEAEVAALRGTALLLDAAFWPGLRDWDAGCT